MEKNHEQFTSPPEKTNSVEPSPENGVDREYQDLLKHNHPVNSGKEGLIYYLAAEELSPSLKHFYEQAEQGTGQDSAVKVLKVYSGRAKREFEAQEQARHIIESHIAQYPEEADNFARVPAAIDHRTIQIDDETRRALNQEGASLSGGNVEIIAMNFIHGEDLATVMYKWVVEHCPEEKSHILNGIRQGNFGDLQTAVSGILEFERASTKGASAEDRQLAERRVNIDNAKKVYGYLKKTGFKISSKVINQITNTRKLLERNGFYHNDEHERNFMLAGDQVFLIDFAAAANHAEEGSQINIELELAQLTEEYEQAKLKREEQSRQIVFEKIRSLSETDLVGKMYESMLASSHGDPKRLELMLHNRGAGSVNNESGLESFMSLLLRFEREQKISRPQCIAMVEGLKQTLVVREKKRRQTVSRVTNPFIYNKINSYKPLFY